MRLPIHSVIAPTRMRSFDALSERESLALAISQEEEDARIYGDMAEEMQTDYPATAEVLRKMREEEGGHRRRLIELFQTRFGDHIPLIQRDEIKGFIRPRATWQLRPVTLKKARSQVGMMEMQSRRFYEHAAAHTSDATARQLLD